MPGPREAAARSVADIIAAIERLEPRDREQLYLTLLNWRRIPLSTSGSSASVQAPDERNEKVLKPASPRTYLSEPSVVPAPSFAPRHKPKKIELRLYDMDNIAPAFSKETLGRLETHLARIDEWTDQLPDHLRAMGLSFSVTQESRLPTAQERKTMAPLVFPFYFIDERIGVGATDKVQRLFRIMDDHGVPEFVPGLAKKIRNQIESDWNSSLRAVTVPPGTLANVKRAPKCVFMRGARLATESQRDERYYSNVVVHEFGHACNLSGPTAHVHDGTAMESAKSVAEMKRELYKYNKRHATAISSTLSLLSAIAVVAALTTGCGHGPPRYACHEPGSGDCQGCDAPSLLSLAEQRAQGAAAVASLIAAERKSGLFTDGVGGDESLRYFRVEPAVAWDVSGAHEPATTRLSDLDEVARAHPRRGVYWVTIRIAGYAGRDRVFIRVDAVDHAWREDHFLDEATSSEYCVRNDGTKLTVDIVTPIVILKD